MMTRNEARDRARQIWPNVKEVYAVHANGQRWQVIGGGAIHTLDGNGHTDCHPECARIEGKLNTSATEPDEKSGARVYHARTRRTMNELARRFIERSEALGYKGMRRDKAALDYFVGAAGALEISGDTHTAQAIGTTCALVISVRGYKAVQELAANE